MLVKNHCPHGTALGETQSFLRRSSARVIDVIPVVLSFLNARGASVDFSRPALFPLHRCAGQGPGVWEVAQCPKEAGDVRRHWADLHLFRPHSVSKALAPRSRACPGSCFSGDWTDLQLCARQQVTLCLYPPPPGAWTGFYKSSVSSKRKNLGFHCILLICTTNNSLV